MESLQIQPYDWHGDDVDGTYTVRMWCHTNHTEDRPSERILVRIEDYKPTCCIELPIRVGNRITDNWTVEKVEHYKSWLRRQLKDHAPIKMEACQREKLYFYDGGKRFPFFICTFDSEAAMRHCINLIRKQGYIIPAINPIAPIVGRIHEDSINTIHRMMTDIDIGYAQWITVEAEPVDELDRISRGREYIASYKNITPMKEEDCRSWIARPILLAFDIECYSSNKRAMPNKSYRKDVVYQISVIVQRQGLPNTRKRKLLTLADCNDLEDAEVIKYKTEEKLILGLCDQILLEDPSLITGYNIYGFDLPYLNERLSLRASEWRSCSCLIREPCIMKSFSWQSSAYGTVIISSLTTEGRITVDMYIVIRRDYGQTLEKFTLDHVAHHFLGHGKHDVTAQQMFEAYDKFLASKEDPSLLPEVRKEMTRIGAYCLEDAALCFDLMDKLNTWLMLVELANVLCVKPIEVFTRGQQARVVNQVYKYTHRNGYIMDQRDKHEESVKGAYIYTPIPGNYKYLLIFDFASLYPSIIRAYNICHSTLVTDDRVPDDDCNILEWDEDDKHYRYRFIKEEKFHGILPRMCKELVEERSRVRKMIRPDNDPLYNVILDQRQNGLKITANSIYGSLGYKEGKVTLLEAARSVTAMGRKLINDTASYIEKHFGGKIVYGDTDSVMVDLGLTNPYDCMRMGEKVSKDISSQFKDPLRLEFERAFAVGIFITKKRYAGIPLASIDARGKEVVRVDFDPEYEDESSYLYRVGNKYVSVPKDVDITGQDTIYGTPLLEGGALDQRAIIMKGVLNARRDFCKWQREVYRRLLLTALAQRGLNDATWIIDSEITRLMQRNIDLTEVITTASVKASYSEKATHPMKFFTNDLRQKEIAIQAGDRIEFVIVKDADPERNTMLGLKYRTLEQYYRDIDIEPLDREEYIRKLTNQVGSLMLIVYNETSNYITKWIERLNAKTKLTMRIKTEAPHFPSQDPYFSCSHKDIMPRFDY